MTVCNQLNACVRIGCATPTQQGQWMRFLKMLEIIALTGPRTQAVTPRTCRAGAGVADGWNVFRERWAALHPLSHARRHSVLSLLQPLAEIQVPSSCHAMFSRYFWLHSL